MTQLGETKRGKEIGKESSRRYGGHLFIWAACEICGKERWVVILKGKPKTNLCQKCNCSKMGKLTANRYGAEASNWKGGRFIDKEGYVFIRLHPKDFFYPMASRGNKVREHRLVMAKHLNRCLLPWEVVHHKNGVKDDNRIENLQLLPDARFHLVENITKQYIKNLEKQIEKLQKENQRLQYNWDQLGEEHSCIIPRINALSDTFRAIAFPGGRPGWMNKEQWTELAGEKEE